MPFPPPMPILRRTSTATTAAMQTAATNSPMYSGSWLEVFWVSSRRASSSGLTVGSGLAVGLGVGSRVGAGVLVSKPAVGSCTGAGVLRLACVGVGAAVGAGASGAGVAVGAAPQVPSAMASAISGWPSLVTVTGVDVAVAAGVAEGAGVAVGVAEGAGVAVGAGPSSHSAGTLAICTGVEAASSVPIKVRLLR